MDFSLDDSQLALQETARRFAQQEIAPHAGHYDQTGEFPREIIRKAWETGLASVSIPSSYGGVGLTLFESCLVVEELSWGCAGMATSIMCNDLGLTPARLRGIRESIGDVVVFVDDDNILAANYLTTVKQIAATGVKE